jgi:hypothetical protein
VRDLAAPWSKSYETLVYGALPRSVIVCVASVRVLGRVLRLLVDAKKGCDRNYFFRPNLIASTGHGHFINPFVGVRLGWVIQRFAAWCIDLHTIATLRSGVAAKRACWLLRVDLEDALSF